MLVRSPIIIFIRIIKHAVRNANQIVVIDKGSIVQQGTHNQLMKQEGIYKRFVDSREKAVSWKLAH